jgi:probable HAF family extracellular repeat protein
MSICHRFTAVSAKTLCAMLILAANQTRTATAVVLFVLAIFSTQMVFGQGLNMTPLHPPNSRSGYTVPLGVNKTGAVVGSYIDSTSGNKTGFLYSAKVYTKINPPGTSTWSRANGINDLGEIVGDYLTSDSRYHGFKYSAGTYTNYDEDTSESCGIFGINSTGDFVGNVGNGPVRAFVNIGGVKTEFTPSGAVSAYAYAINTTHEVVGTYFDGSNNAHGFSWVSGTIKEIKYPGAVQTYASGINDGGEITGTYTLSNGLTYGFTLIKGVYTSTDFADTGGVSKTGAYAGYYWGVPDGFPAAYLAIPTKFTLTPITLPGGAQQGGFDGINNAGVFVGGYADSTGKQHGMMLSAGVVTNIDDPKGVMNVCHGINTTNHIVGTYYDTSGNPHGFLYSGGTFTDIPGPSGSVFSEATGINDNGDIVGDFYLPSNGNFHGFILKSGVYKDLPVSGAYNTFGGGINATDQATFWWMDAAGYRESVLWNGNKFTAINVPGMAQSLALGINKTGWVSYLVSDPYNVIHAALKKGTSYYIIDDPKGSQTAAFGINDTGYWDGSYQPKGKTVPQPLEGK